MNLNEPNNFPSFIEWAKEHLGQGYSLELEDGTFVDPVTRWAFVAYKAGRKAAAMQRVRDGRSFMKELYSTILWLYRRLPRAYSNPPHIDVVVRKLAQMVGEDAEEFIAERKDV